jgi:hypothetical protein
VHLEPTTGAALKQLGVSVAPVGTGAFDSATSTVLFPITGGFAAIHADMSYKPGYISGSIIHEGSGLTFSKGGKSLTVTNFVADPGDSTLTASVGGKVGVALFSLDGTNVKVTPAAGDVTLDGTVARLTATAADALNQTFSVSAFQAGMPIGVVHLIAAS